MCAECTNKAAGKGAAGCVGAGVQDMVTSFRMMLNPRLSLNSRRNIHSGYLLLYSLKGF